MAIRCHPRACGSLHARRIRSKNQARVVFSRSIKYLQSPIVDAAIRFVNFADERLVDRNVSAWWVATSRPNQAVGCALAWNLLERIAPVPLRGCARGHGPGVLFRRLPLYDCASAKGSGSPEQSTRQGWQLSATTGTCARRRGFGFARSGNARSNEVDQHWDHTMASDLEGDRYRYDALFYEYQREGSARSARALLPRVVDALGTRQRARRRMRGRRMARRVRQPRNIRSRRRRRRLCRPLDAAGRGGPGSCRATSPPRSTSVGSSTSCSAWKSASMFPRRKRDARRQYRPARQARALLRGGSRTGGRGTRQRATLRVLAGPLRRARLSTVRLRSPRIQDDDRIEPWYRYNVLFFCHDDAIGELPPAVTATRVPDDMPVKDFSARELPPAQGGDARRCRPGRCRRWPS